MKGIREVKITVQFITGTTIEGKSQSENHTLRLLKDLLKKYNIASESSNGLFTLKIQGIDSKELG